MKIVRLNEHSNFVIDLGETPEDRQRYLKESTGKDGKISLRVRIEAIHETVTKNHIRYPSDRLKGDPEFIKEGKKAPTGVHSWTRPYPKPMLVNHDIYEKPLGRIIDAQYLEKTTDSRPGIETLVEISDQEAIEMIQDGRYYTVSIGADTDGLFCNICGENIIESSECTHWKGETYDGKKCHWSVGNLWFLELSFVNVPADDMARVLDPGQVIKHSAKESKDDVFIIDEESRKLIPFSVLAESSGKEEDILPENKNPENTDVSTVDDEDKTQEDIDLKDKADSDEPATEEEDTSEDLEEKVANLETQLQEAVTAHQKILEALKSVVENSVIEESDEDDVEDEEGSEPEISELEEKIANLEKENNALKEENQELSEKALAMQAEKRKSTIDKIIEMRISLGKSTEEDYEQELSVYSSRSEESLQDTLSDLEKEIKNPKKPREKQTVSNPGLVDNDQKGIMEDDDSSSTSKKEDKLTPDLVIRKLLAGDKDK